MLNKLMKHELNATARLLVPLYLILLVTTVINRFVLRLDIYEGILGIIPVFLISAYCILIVSIVSVTFLLMIIRFYKNLLSDEGYLMFTLPTKGHQLITSKLIITVFWIIVSISTILASLYIVFATPYRINIVIDVIKDFSFELQNTFHGNQIFLYTELIILCLLSLVANILLIYVSIAIGQLVNGHRLIGSFLSYIVITTAAQFIIVIILFVLSMFTLGNPFDFSAIINFLFPISIVLTLIECIIFYVGTNYIFKRKLNLE